MTKNPDNPRSNSANVGVRFSALQQSEGAAAELARRMKEREQSLTASKAGGVVDPVAKPRGRKPLFGT